jgi:hypothetical protein
MAVLRNNNRQRDKDVFANIGVIVPIEDQSKIRNLYTRFRLQQLLNTRLRS